MGWVRVEGPPPSPSPRGSRCLPWPSEEGREPVKGGSEIGTDDFTRCPVPVWPKPSPLGPPSSRERAFPWDGGGLGGSEGLEHCFSPSLIVFLAQDFQPAATQPGRKHRFLRPRSSSGSTPRSPATRPLLSPPPRHPGAITGTATQLSHPLPSAPTAMGVPRQSPILGDFGGPMRIPTLQSPSPSFPLSRAELELMVPVGEKRQRLRL